MIFLKKKKGKYLTVCLKSDSSFFEMVSAFAMIGIILTCVRIKLHIIYHNMEIKKIILK